MIEFVPLALACGHSAEGWLTFRLDDGEPPRVECPQGCGFVQFIAEPSGLIEADPES